MVKKIKENAPYMAGVLALLMFLLAWGEFGAARDDQRALALMEKSESWTVVPGEIVGREMEEFTVGRFSHSAHTHYRVVVTYRYEAGGQARTGQRVCFQGGNCGFGMHEDGANLFFQQFHPGAPVDVAHDPSDPGQAVLFYGVSPEFAPAIRKHYRDALVTLVVGIVLAVFVVRTAPEFREGAGEEKVAEGEAVKGE